jgi:hypothetical protein
MQVNVLGSVLWAQGARFCTRRLVGTRAPHKVKKRRNKFLHLRHQARKENGSTMFPGASRGPILGTWLAGAPHKTAQDPAQDFHKTRTRQDNFASRKHSTRATHLTNMRERCFITSLLELSLDLPDHADPRTELQLRPLPSTRSRG